MDVLFLLYFNFSRTKEFRITKNSQSRTLTNGVNRSTDFYWHWKLHVPLQKLAVVRFCCAEILKIVNVIPLALFAMDVNFRARHLLEQQHSCDLHMRFLKLLRQLTFSASDQQRRRKCALFVSVWINDSVVCNCLMVLMRKNFWLLFW